MVRCCSNISAECFIKLMNKWFPDDEPHPWALVNKNPPSPQETITKELSIIDYNNLMELFNELSKE